MMKKYSKGLVEYGIVFAAMILWGVLYHFDTIQSGFDLLPGDGGDALLNMLAADSWGDVFRGEVAFSQNRIYYPFPAGRGFTDLSLTLYLLELPWRVFAGMGMFASALTVYGLLFHFGILSMFYLLRSVLHLNFAAALGGALLSFYCNACWVKLLHTQFFFMGLLPLLAICVIRYCQLWSSGYTLRRILYGMGACLTFAWIAYSNFYTAFFAGLGGGIYFVIYWILLAKRGVLKKLLIPKRIGEVIFLALWGAALFALFFCCYMPLLNDDYERVWTAAQGTLPTPADIVNIGPQNLLWGRLYDWAFPPIHKYVYENYHGLPLLTLAVLFFCLYVFWKQRRKLPAAFVALPAMLGVMYVISVKFAHCISLWYFVWKYIPGGSAIRAGGRIYVFLMFPLMIFLWWMIDRYVRRFSMRKRLLICGVLFAVLTLDNFNTMDLYGWKRSETVTAMQKIPSPPADMKCFFIIDTAGGVPDHNNWAKYGLQAWSMARYFKSFAINGYSGNYPAGFTALDPLSPTYRQEIADWVKQHDLKSVYSYDTAAGTWKKEHSN